MLLFKVLRREIVKGVELIEILLGTREEEREGARGVAGAYSSP